VWLVPTVRFRTRCFSRREDGSTIP
jgi:hypothetical protein